jgi:hypothetical protein
LPESEEEISALPINSETKAIVFNAWFKQCIWHHLGLLKLFSNLPSIVVYNSGILDNDFLF